MVVKKYLCAAPRPESWEEKAEALLKSMGGDKAKCKAVARQTLSTLRERHKHEKKRSGPGRKSNAEHAIAFYEYLAGDKAIGDEDDHGDDDTQLSDDDESSSSSSNDESSASNTVDTEEFLNQHDDTCDVCNLGGELICCSTCSLVFHKECLRPVMKTIPSGWICPYCITDGVNNFKRHSKTWKSAESGIRQMKRLKEELEDVSVEGKDNKSAEKEVKKEPEEKKENAETTVVEASAEDNTTKPEKTETKASENKSSPTEEKKGEQKKEVEQQKLDDEGKQKLKDEKEGNTSSASSVSSAGAASESKRSLALYKIADSHSNSTESLVVTGRRQRKQPTLYQPQMCADSRWKSDENHLGTGSSDSNDSDDNISDSEIGGHSKGTHRNPRRVLNKKITREPKNEDNVVISIGEDEKDGKKTSSPFCNFCHDDTSISICVFCGCRKCFGKHDKNSLLLCDSCDDEYHLSCLGLKTVPSAKKWYCPACAKTKSGSNSKLYSTRRASTVGAQASDSDSDASKSSSRNKKKRTRGRPRKLRDESESTPTLSSHRKRSRTPKAAALSGEKMEQRKRGRPSKSTKSTPTTTPSSGRKRGRPPKNTPTPTPTSPSKASLSPTPRKRGRPPKASPDAASISNKTDSTVKRKLSKPATPSTTPNKSITTTKIEVPAKTPEPVKVSRVSGRTVKRASFHDEVDEGEQHLRSLKSPQPGDSQSTSQTSKPGVVKSQESPAYRRNSKSPEKSEPSRKKQKHEEKASTQTKDTLNETKPSKAQNKITSISKDKDEETADPPPIAPVRMKPVLEPPAAPIAPVRMKPVLQSPTPVAKPPVSVVENENSAKTEPNTEKSDEPAVDTKDNTEEKKEAEIVQATDDPVVSKSELSKKVEMPSPPLVPPKTKNQGATVAVKTAAPKLSAPRASPTLVHEVPSTGSIPLSSIASTFTSSALLDPVALDAAVRALPKPIEKKGEKTGVTKIPRRKPGARECMQISRRFGVNIIPEKYMTTLLDYCHRGKVEHLIKMRERLDCHSRFLEYQLAGLEARVKEVGESKIVVPPMPLHKRDSSSRHRGAAERVSPTPPVVNKKPASNGNASTIKAVVPNQALGKKPTTGGALAKTIVDSTTKKIPPTKSTEVAKQTSLSTVPTAPKPLVTQPLALVNKTKTN